MSVDPRGGYQLASPPEEYTVGMIVRLLEGELSPVVLTDEPGNYEQADRFVTADVWQEIKDAIDDVVDNITLAELVRRYHEKGNCEYYI